MKKPQYQLMTTAFISLFTFAASINAAPGYQSGKSLPNQYSQTIVAAQNGVIANDGRDDAKAIQAIIDGISINNNPSNLIRILLPKGQVDINDEIHVDRSGIVIEGQGNDPQTGTKVVVNSWKPYEIDSKNAPDFNKSFWPGFAAFRTETRMMHPKKNAIEGGINFHWNHSIEFERPASQGDTVLAINSAVERHFSVGDLIYVGAASDDAFLNMAGVVEEKRNNKHIVQGHMRTQIFKVVAIDESNDEVTIDKPLEFDIPLQNSSGYNSRVMPVKAIENVGYRNFYMTMNKVGTNCENLNSGVYSTNNPNGVRLRYLNMCAESAIHGLVFKWAYNGFVDNVKIVMIGSHPIVTEFAKNMTFKNNMIDGAWNKGAGGNGYFRGSKLYDSLIEDNRIENVRHLTLQWSATGNVVRNNYLNADINLHGGWERNNIIYNNETHIPFEHRSWETDGKPRNGEQASGTPSNSTWQPFWYASGDHATNWSGPSGPNNIFVNNTFNKGLSQGARIERWNLFDTVGTKYTLGWDGQAFDHVNVNGKNVETWTQQIAQDVAADIPNSGVYIEFINNNDLDNDGVVNNQDQCPATAANKRVNVNGCDVISNDTDGDGVLNPTDSCPNTLANKDVDERGCEIIDGDDDLDNVLNSADQCPNTPSNSIVDERGCTIVDGDNDNDGVLNSVDQCPNSLRSSSVDENGCVIETTTDGSGSDTNENSTDPTNETTNETSAPIVDTTPDNTDTNGTDTNDTNSGNTNLGNTGAITPNQGSTTPDSNIPVNNDPVRVDPINTQPIINEPVNNGSNTPITDNGASTNGGTSSQNPTNNPIDATNPITSAPVNGSGNTPVITQPVAVQPIDVQVDTPVTTITPSPTNQNSNNTIDDTNNSSTASISNSPGQGGGAGAGGGAFLLLLSMALISRKKWAK